MRQHEAESERGYNSQSPFVSPALISLTLEQKSAAADAKQPMVRRPIALQNIKDQKINHN